VAVALVAAPLVWLAVQANPGIPLFAAMYDSAARALPEPVPTDVAAMLVESAQSAASERRRWASEKA